MKKYSLIIIVVLSLFIVTGCSSSLKYSYTTKEEPFVTYDVSLDYKTNKLKVNTKTFCKKTKCKTEEYKYKITLKDYEVKAIKSAKKSKNYSKKKFTEALKYIAMNDSIFTGKQGNNDWNKKYKKYDTNKDEYVTCKEYGMYIINHM